MPSKPFWEEKSLEEMNHEEWESLCDGCGKCCLQKLEDEDTGQIHYTALACSLLDVETCRCKDYKQRHKKIPQCIKLNPEKNSRVRISSRNLCLPFAFWRQGPAPVASPSFRLLGIRSWPGNFGKKICQTCRIRRCVGTSPDWLI